MREWLKSYKVTKILETADFYTGSQEEELAVDRLFSEKKILKDHLTLAQDTLNMVNVNQE
jgi:hypothetical protein